jgi:hypothetical protein
MNNHAASRAVSRIATPKNRAASPAFLIYLYVESGASRGLFIIPRKRDKGKNAAGPARTGYFAKLAPLLK